MNIIVCIKQVPETSEVEIDEETGVLKREGIDSKMNPFDLYALETAIRIKESNSANVSVLTMGPPQASDIIKESRSLIMKFGKEFGLRTLDALHIAGWIMVAEPDWEFVSSDKNQLQVVAQLNYKTIAV